MVQDFPYKCLNYKEETSFKQQVSNLFLVGTQSKYTAVKSTPDSPHPNLLH